MLPKESDKTTLLLDYLNDIQKEPEISQKLGLACQAFYKAELYERAIIYLLDREFKQIHLGHFGVKQEELEKLYASYDFFESLLEKLSKSEKYKGTNSYYLTEDEQKKIIEGSEKRTIKSDIPKKDLNEGWDPDDFFLIPINNSKNEAIGLATLDDSVERKRPTPSLIKSLEAFVSAVGIDIERVLLNDSLQKNLELLKTSRQKELESEVRYRTIFENSEDGIFLITTDGKNIVDYNPKTLELFDCKESELLEQKSFSPEFQPDGKPSREKLKEFIKIASKDKSINFQWSFLTSKGKPFFGDVTLSKVEINQKNFLYVVVNDTTEKVEALEQAKQNYQKLEKQRRHQKFLNEFLEVVTSATDLKTPMEWAVENLVNFFNADFGMVAYPWEKEEPFAKILYASARNKEKDLDSLLGSEIKIKGDSEREARIDIYKVRKEPWFEDDLRCLGRRVEEGNAKSCIGDLIEPFNDKDWLINISFHKDYHNFSESEVKLFQDVVRILRKTIEQFQLTKEKKESDERYKVLIENSPLAISITRNGEILFVNKRCLEILGYSKPQEMVGKPVLKFIGKADRQNMIQRMEKEWLEKRVEEKYETIGLRKNGEEFDISVRVAPLPLKDEIVTLGIFRDITQEKQLKSQLIQAQKMESIGTLAGGIAHDFNNILNGILGFASLLEMQSEWNAKSENYISKIIKSSKRASELVAQLLTFARKEKFDSKKFNIHSTIKDVFGIVTHSFDKKIEVVLYLKAKNSFTLGDEGKIEQVLLNFLNNSRDAMPQGGKITVSTSEINLAKTELELPEDYILIKIVDTGSGISKENLSKIFEPFFTTKEVGKGTGLGLSTAYGIIESHNGFVKIDSVLGEGTEVKLYLPKVKEQELTYEVKAESKPVRGSGTILVIEDEDFLREFLETSLEVLGYSVLLAEDGEKGVEIFEQNKLRITLVICDMIMPNMNGKETFAKLKEIDPNVKVLFSSGYSKEKYIEEVEQGGAVGFLNKPYGVEDLSKAIKEILNSEI